MRTASLIKGDTALWDVEACAAAWGKTAQAVLQLCRRGLFKPQLYGRLHKAASSSLL
jgi:hypothetical protein